MRIQLGPVVGSAIALAAVALLFAEIKVPAVGIDDSESEVRGALGVSIENLSLSNDSGKLSFLLNGGSLLLSGAFACIAIAKCRRTKENARIVAGVSCQLDRISLGG
jgi:hypothetical protein